MSNLSKRVEKAKKLSFSHNHYEPGHYGTWGRGDDPERGTKYYRVQLSHSKTTVCTPDGDKPMMVLQCQCTKDTGRHTLSDCPGNSRHTVCYHSLGALYQSFKDAGKLISFFETYESASRMTFGGKIVKISSQQGPGFLWAVIKDWPAKQTFQERVSLMRGAASDEGID